MGARWLHLLAVGLAVAVSTALATVPADAARHALLVGVDKYEKRFGIEPLNTGDNDAEAMAQVLALRGINFTDIVVLKDVRDKSAFSAELDRFLKGVGQGDEVVFFFSGHGLNIDGRNFFLLPDAKSQGVYLDGRVDGRPVLDPAKRRKLDTKEKQDSSYREWLSQVALDEKAIEDAIWDRGVSALVILADACRTQPTGAKSAVVVSSGLAMPKSIQHGVFRLYSASEGQVAYGAPELMLDPQAASRMSKAQKTAKGAKDADAPRYTSLFTRVLVSELPKAYKSFGILAEAVKYEVYERSISLKLGDPQTPDHSQSPGSYGFKFVIDAGDLTAHCRTAPEEYQRLLDGVLQGGVGADVIRRKSIELDPCGWSERVQALLKFERLGTGFLSAPPGSQTKPPDANDPYQQCDYLAGSPHDKDLPEDIVPGEEITKLALAAVSGQTSHDRAVQKIDAAIKACETAVKDRPRVDRYKFNLGRSYYAMATVAIPPLEHQVLLEKASRYLTEAAVELGYPAAYNFLGQLYLNGEVHEMKGSTVEAVPPDREMAVKLFKRGASLNDVLANYNLGMAYKRGENGLFINSLEAFPFFSKAAEAGFVQAMVETARALRCGCGVANATSNEKRAIDLLEDAAKRGSAEAMLLLGSFYEDKGDELFRQSENDGKGLATVEFNRALRWYARAAEVGDASAQERLADMLTRGIGVPGPQPEAAGRYWRLAAEGGSVDAQLKLADLIRVGTVPPRPQTKGKTEAGAQEIRDLYSSAFARGKPRAGIELARLLRKGYPELVRGGSEAIPRNPEQAIRLLRAVKERVRTAPSDSEDANPEHEVWAAYELIDMYDKGEHVLADGSKAITEDEIFQLRSDYGNPNDAMYVRVGAFAPLSCSRGPNQFMVLIWNSKRAEAPSERTLDWFERYTRCPIPWSTRDLFRREHQEWLKGGKSYVERMTERALGSGRR